MQNAPGNGWQPFAPFAFWILLFTVCILHRKPRSPGGKASTEGSNP
jgi:hypothetical protein